MSRVNRYRGMHNGEWVYGYYAVIGIRDVIIKMNPENFYSVDDDLEKKNGNEIVDVKADTVGQHIGIPDKNGKEIYEKDIILVDGEYEYFVVEWDNDTARFVMNSETLTVDFDNYWGYQVEVVGNVYENADLLKEAGNE